MKKNNILHFDKMEIASILQEYHSLFRFFWDYGNCKFSTDFPTSWVNFDSQHGDFINFNFNPKFYETLDMYNRSWICSHEMLHIMLEHGIRMKQYPKEDIEILNKATDIVINEMTVSSFGFNRGKIINWEKYCWIDTLFEDINKVERNKSFHYYYELLKSGKNLKKQDSNGKDKGKLVDIHTFGELSKREQKQIIDILGKLAKNLSQEEMEKFFKNEEEIKGASKFNKNLNDIRAGNGMGFWSNLKIGNIKKKKKWETVIRNWEKYSIKMLDEEFERWDRKNRRFSDILVNKNYFLPMSVEIEDINWKKNKILVFMVLDTSGSTYHLKDRFFKAALSLDPKIFEVRLLNFDTSCYETTLKSGKVYGGGGTSFSCINPKIEEICKKENKPFPKSVFVISDGFSYDNVNTKYPNRWHWFLIEGGSKEYIPKESHIYKLENYE